VLYSMNMPTITVPYTITITDTSTVTHRLKKLQSFTVYTW
jgi:hypothetical protein